MIQVHASPLTGKIYAGKPLKSGMWGKTKYDVTDMATSAVADSLLITQEKLVFEQDGKTYELSVKEVK